MFRKQVHRITSVRFNSTSSAADIDALLERVKNLTKGFDTAKPGRKFNRNKNAAPRANVNAKADANADVTANANEDTNVKGNSRSRASFKGIDHGEITGALDEYSAPPIRRQNNNTRSSFQRNQQHSSSSRPQQTQRPLENLRPTNIDRVPRGRTQRSNTSPSVQRAPRDARGGRADFTRGAPRPNATGGRRGAFRGGARGGARGGSRRTGSNFRSNPINSIVPNPNLDLVSKEYILQAPTQQKLLELSPLLSHDPQSRILKAIRASLQDSNTDIGAVFKGELRKTDLSIHQSKLKTKNLKFNASIVANALDSNNTIDYATKVKILGPLIGTASAKELSLPSQ